VRAAVLAGGLGLLGGCWGLPALMVTATPSSAAQEFRFGYCSDGRRAPQLTSITVSSVAGGEVVCSLHLRPGAGTVAVPRWTYGSDLPSLAPQGLCAPLRSGQRYRVDVFGGGVGGQVFAVTAGGQPVGEGQSCSVRAGPR
jgi:hypothetical protein